MAQPVQYTAEPGYCLMSVSQVIFSLCLVLSFWETIPEVVPSYPGVRSHPMTPGHLFRSLKSPFSGTEITGAPE